jgi:hypothetical protein
LRYALLRAGGEVCDREKGRWALSTYGLVEKVAAESLGVQFSVRGADAEMCLLRKMHRNLLSARPGKFNAEDSLDMMKADPYSG